MPGKQPTRQRTQLSAHFDEEQIFEDEIRPLMEQIQATAVAHGIPFVIGVGYAHSPAAGFATASVSCTVDGRNGAELYVAIKLLSNPAFARFVLQLLDTAGEATTRSLSETPLPQRLM